MKYLINYFLFSFGFKDQQDFLETTFFIKGMMAKSIFLSVGLGLVGVVMEDIIGLKPAVYLSLVVLFILEFFTGVTASVYIKKEKFNSWKMGRIVLKIFVYTTILGLFNIFSHKIGSHTIFSFDFNFFEWIYYIILNVLVLQLFISVLENCETLGFKEVSVILRIFRKRVKEIEDTVGGKGEQEEEGKS